MAGLWFEELVPGRFYRHPITRTVTETDNILFSTLTHNPQPLHIDRHFSAATPWGQPLMNSYFTLGLMVGIAVSDMTVGTTHANLGMNDVHFPSPLFQGDTISVTTEIISKRPSKSHPGRGIVDFRHQAFKQSGELVATCLRQAMINCRPANPG